MPALEAILRVRRRTRHRGIRDRHAASRPAQRAGQFHGQALCRDLLRIPGQCQPIPSTSTARATSNTISAPRPTARSAAALVHLSLAANPSHLEAVNPVVLGKVRAKQHQRGDTERNAGGRHPDAWRRRLRRPGARRRVARTVGSARLLHRRHDPHHRQQPDRLHDRPRRMRAPAPTRPMSRRASRRRSSTSTATIRRRSSKSRAPRSNTASASRRTSSSTCSAIAATATTRATSRPSPSR